MSRIEDALRRAGEDSNLPTPLIDVPTFGGAAAPTEGSNEPVGDDGSGPGASGATDALGLSPWAAGVGRTVEAKYVASPEMRPVSIEQYRRLAAVLHHAQIGRGIKVLMVSSALPGEGKTLTAANLALTLSESYRRRVLIIDADLRRPTMHDVFQIPNLAGLSDGLKSTVFQKMPLVAITPNLSVLPAGRPDPDPMSSLTSDRMKQVIQQAAERFDWVIIDTPPIVMLPDGNLVAAMVETVLLVVAAGKTPYAALQKTVTALGRDRIIGVVLNRVNDRAVSSSLGWYQYDNYSAPRPAPPAIAEGGA